MISLVDLGYAKEGKTMNSIYERGMLMEMDRRGFLKGAAVTSLLMGSAALTGAYASTALAVEDDSKGSIIDDHGRVWDDEAEVVVIGCGSGGAPAAIEAARAGADVLVIEKMDWLGGCMRCCGGGLIGCNTMVQDKLGVEDPGPDVLFDYMKQCAHDNVDEDLLRMFVDECGPTVDWVITPLEEGGLGGQPLEEWEFSTEDDGHTGLVSPGLSIGAPSDQENNYWAEFGYPEDIEHRRVHWFKPNTEDEDPGDRHYAAYTGNDFGAGHGSLGGGGTGLWKPFEDELNRLDNVRIQMDTQIVELITSDDGEVIGVAVQPREGGDITNIKATQGVVIATGTFVVNKELYENFTGKKWTYLENPMSVVNGSPYNDYQADGAGIIAAMAVGAAPRYILEGNSGGLRINTKSQALDNYGKVIPRLYITSRAVGGLFAEDHYPQCGVFVTSSIITGRNAGINAVLEPHWDNEEEMAVKREEDAAAAEEEAKAAAEAKAAEEAAAAEAAANAPAEEEAGVDCSPCHGDAHKPGEENPHGY